MQCPTHGVEFVLKPAGISKKTGKPYNAFWACPASFDCKEKPPEGQQGGWQGVRQQVAERVNPGKAVMTREDWEAKEARTDRKILLQVAFKAAVELASAGKINSDLSTGKIEATTLQFHTWLLSQTEGQKPVSGLSSASQTLPIIHVDEVDGDQIPFGDDEAQ